LSSGQNARLDALKAVVDAVQPVKAHVGGSGHKRSAKLHLEKPMTARAVGGRCASVASRPGSPGMASSQATGWARHRHVVKRALAWLVGYRRLQVR
jgi:hypothetical protein